MTKVSRGDTIYELGPCLGKGGFGVCYKAIERSPTVGSTSNERIVAVKKINQQMIKEAAKEPYLRYEIALHSQLRHQNVAELFITFSNQDSIYFVLEYCNKKSLADIIVRVTTLPIDLAAYYFCQMMTGLKYIHGCQILHRDLKLSNILVDADDIVKITDFGLSCTVTRSYLERHLSCGTPNYLSPEVLLRQGHTAKSDIWSCGVVLYAMFGGIPPFQTEELLEIYRNIVTGSYHYTKYHSDDHLKHLIDQLLQLDPEERPELDDILRHEFTRYGEQYERHLTHEPKASGICVSLGRGNSVHTMSKSLTSLFAKSKSDTSDEQHDSKGLRQQCTVQRVSNGVPRSLTVVDVKLLRTTNLLQHFRARPAWTKRATEFQAGWITWWRDKTSVVGYYYQLSTGYNCALYNDATSCLYHPESGRAYFLNLRSNRRLHSEESAKLDTVNKFYEPMLRDVMEEFQDVSATSLLGEQVSWVSQSSRNSGDSVDYLTSWSTHCGDTYRVFYLSDDSIQVNFADAFVLRMCGRLCYFYQPAGRSFLVESKPLDIWCFQENNNELVDVLCDIFLS